MSEIVGVVLAAGFGTRLRPSTNWCPKPLITVAGLEPLFVALAQAHEHGIRKVVVNAHHLSGQIKEALNSWRDKLEGMEIRISIEQSEILGTGGGLLKIIHDNPDWFQGASMLVQNGDTLGCFDFKKLLDTLKTLSCFSMSFDPEFLKKYHPLWVDRGTLNWTGIGAKEPTTGSLPAHLLGVHGLSLEAIRVIQKNPDVFAIKNTDLFNGIYRPLVERGFQFKGVEALSGEKNFDKDNFWFDMTNEKFLIEAQKFILDNLSAPSRWLRFLKKRYPQIREIKKGVWMSGLKLQNPGKIESPSIMVSDFQEEDISPLAGDSQFGPYLSLQVNRRLSTSLDHSGALSRVSVVIKAEAPKNAEVHWPEFDVRVL